MANKDLNLPWYTEEYLFDADVQPPFPGSAELDGGPGDQGPDETQNSPARSDADNSPESEEEHVPIPENGLPRWIAVGVQYNPSDLRKYFLCDDEPTNLSSGEAPSNQQPTPDKGKAMVEDDPTRLDPNLAAKMEKAKVKETTRRSLEQDLLTVPGFAVNDHRESSGQRSKGNLDSSCPPRPTTEVEKTAEGVHRWIDEMLRNVMIANQERDQIQSRLKEAEKKLLKLSGCQPYDH
ncbi:hypothetical protein R1sor_019111 [Riccia sorocarpa]|uniref:Uncharacterized protein n=1 Tax=Riccia sorocarpa TaxID=122646 RepID=A0ABD3IHT7_9MARC